MGAVARARCATQREPPCSVSATGRPARGLLTSVSQDPWIVSCPRLFPIPRTSERLSLLGLAVRMQLRPGLSHEAVLLEASRDAVQAARVLEPKPCCRLGERDARLLADEREEIVSPAALARPSCASCRLVGLRAVGRGSATPAPRRWWRGLARASRAWAATRRLAGARRGRSALARRPWCRCSCAVSVIDADQGAQAGEDRADPRVGDRLVQLAQCAAEDRSHSLCGAVRQRASLLLWMIAQNVQ